MKARHFSHLALFIQLILTIFFCWIFTSTIYKSYFENTFVFIQALKDFLPGILVCISALITEIILTAKHKARMTERELLPILFLFITLQFFILFPKTYEYTGYYPINYVNGFIIFSRFLLISVSILFLFSSLILLGAQMPKNSSVSFIALIVSFLISLLIPNDTNYLISLGGKDIYNSMLAILVLVIFFIAIVLNIIAIISTEATEKNIQKNIAFILMILANVFIMLNFNYPNLPLIGIALFVISNILLIISSNNY